MGRPAEPGGAGRAGQAAGRAGPGPRGHRVTATRFEEQAAEAEQAARVVRELLVDRDPFVSVWPLAGDRPGSLAPRSWEGTGG